MDALDSNSGADVTLDTGFHRRPSPVASVRVQKASGLRKIACPASPKK